MCTESVPNHREVALTTHDERVREVKKLFADKGLIVEREVRLQSGLAYQLRTVKGPIVNVFDTGKCQLQGQRQDLVRSEIDSINGRSDEELPISRKVFVVYGHDEHARTQLENLLRKWRCEPLLLDQLPSEGHTLIEKLERFQGEAIFGIVLATPDDMGHKVGKSDEAAFRARQNVVLEMGMLLSTLGRTKVAILIKSPAEMERPSDIQGLLYIPFDKDVAEARIQLAKEMNKQGFGINVDDM